MSFVTTRPEALAAAAGALQAIGSSMAAENAGAAAPTTGVLPAAADEVSALQATQFSAYGSWYQQVSDQAAAIHQMLVNNLGANAGSYQGTEAANRVAAGSTSLSGLLNPLAAADPSLPDSAALGTSIGWAQNFPAAASDMFALLPMQNAAGAANGERAPGR